MTPAEQQQQQQQRLSQTPMADKPSTVGAIGSPIQSTPLPQSAASPVEPDVDDSSSTDDSVDFDSSEATSSVDETARHLDGIALTNVGDGRGDGAHRAATAPVANLSSSTVPSYGPLSPFASNPSLSKDENELDRDIALANEAISLVMDAKIAEAENLLGVRRFSSMYCSLGYAILKFVIAAMTFDRNDIQPAVEAFNEALAITSKLRKPSSIAKSATGFVVDMFSSNSAAGSGGNSSNSKGPNVTSTATAAFVDDDDPDFVESPTATASGKVNRSYTHGSLSHYRNMTRIQLHAELVTAECTLFKSFLNIQQEGIVAFLKEGWAINSLYGIYRSLARLTEQAVLDNSPKGRELRERLDVHLVSGLCLGIGAFNLVLSMLPTKLIKIVEFVGYSADRNLGLGLLEIANGWRHPGVEPPGAFTRKNAQVFNNRATFISRTPGTPPRHFLECQGGLRSRLADLGALVYHTILPSVVPINNIDLGFADRIVTEALRYHPNGVFYLFFSGRILLSLAQPAEALVQYHKALNVQRAWLQLNHLCYWEIGLAHAAIREYEQAVPYFGSLAKESNWSKAVFTYLLAVFMWESEVLAGVKQTAAATAAATNATTSSAPSTSAKSSKISFGKKLWRIGSNKANDASGAASPTAATEPATAAEWMAQVPTLLKKLAGKSLSIEKFVIRKARSFAKQNGRLMLPGLEMMHVMAFLEIMPEPTLLQALADIDTVLTKMDPQFIKRWSIADLPKVASEEGAEKAASVKAALEATAPSRFSPTIGDDLCLALSLRAAILCELAHPTRSELHHGSRTAVAALCSLGASGSAKQTPARYLAATPAFRDKLARCALATFARFFQAAPSIVYDHYMIDFAHLDLANLLEARGQIQDAVLELKHVASDHHDQPSKYSAVTAVGLANEDPRGFEDSGMVVKDGGTAAASIPLPRLPNVADNKGKESGIYGKRKGKWSLNDMLSIKVHNKLEKLRSSNSNSGSK